MRLNDRIALVIGAARGIGAGIAERFAEEGAKIVIADREAFGEATAKRLGGHYVQIDVAQKADAEHAVAAALDQHGRLDILVQNAGIYPWTLIENIEPDEWDSVLAVNLKGTYLAARAALTPMKAQRSGMSLAPLTVSTTPPTQPSQMAWSSVDVEKPAVAVAEPGRPLLSPSTLSPPLDSA